MSHKLPIMQCDPGCGECCGPALCTEQEYQQVVGYARNRGIEPLRQGMTCPFYQGGTCSVYEARPFVCRLFGHSEKLTCCRGYNVNIPARREQQLRRDYEKRGPTTRFLHEAAYTMGELTELIVREVEGAASV